MSVELEIDSVTYVFGLDWMPLDPAEADQSRINALAERKGADVVVVHKERGRTSVGYGHDVRPNLASAASAAARARKGIWIAVVKIKEGMYWLIAGENGDVQAGTDMVFNDLTSAVEEMAPIMKVMRVDESFAPAELEDESFLELSPSDLLKPDAGSICVSPVQTFGDQLAGFMTRHKKALVAIMVLTISIVIVQSYAVPWYQARAQEHAQMEKDAQDAEKTKHDQEKEQQTIEKARTAWANMELPSAAIKNCRQGIKLLSLPVAGWKLIERTCVHGASLARFRKVWGAESRLKQDAALRSATISQADEGNATISKKWAVSSRHGNQALLPYAVTKEKFSDIAAWYKVKLTQDPPEKIAGGLLSDTIISRGSVRITDIKDVQKFAAMFDAIPGVGIASAKKSDDGQWSLNLEVYYEQNK